MSMNERFTNQGLRMKLLAGFLAVACIAGIIGGFGIFKTENDRFLQCRHA